MKHQFSFLLFATLSIGLVSCSNPKFHTDKETIKLNSFAANPDPLYVLDGVIISAIDTLLPSAIAEIHVLKGEIALKKYGDKGKFGVVEIISKKAQSVKDQSHPKDKDHRLK